LPGRVRPADNHLQSLRARGRARDLGKSIPGACWERGIDRYPDDRPHLCQSAPLGGGRKRGEQKQAVGRSRGGRNTKIHALADAKGRLLAILLTGGEAHDCPVAEHLIRTVKPSKRLLGDKGYDSGEFREEATHARANHSGRRVSRYRRLGDRERVKGLTTQVLQQGRVDPEAVRDIVRAVIGQTPGNVAVSGLEHRELFADRVRILDEALVRSTSATHGALQRLASRGKDFTDNDLKEALVSLRKLEEDYAAAANYIAEAMSGSLRREMMELAVRAQNVSVEASARVAFAGGIGATPGLATIRGGRRKC
jgi:transposase